MKGWGYEFGHVEFEDRSESGDVGFVEDSLDEGDEEYEENCVDDIGEHWVKRWLQIRNLIGKRRKQLR